jgi:excisionase family DNA binding protein
MNNRTPDSHYPWTKKWGAGHPALVYSLISSGKLGHYRIGNGRGRLRIPEDAIEEYLARCTFGVREEKPAARMPRLKHINL